MSNVLNKKECGEKKKKICQCKLINDNECPIVIQDVESEENDEFLETEVLFDLLKFQTQLWCGPKTGL